MADIVRGRAPAKVNLVLEVTGRRADGYHEIDTVLQELELADEVELHFGESPGVSVDGPYAVGTPADESNLAWNAAALLAEATGRTCDFQLRLTKRIPAAGGLGGGASDAATVLRLLQARWDVADAGVSEIAEKVGSDEAFFLVGGTARARGRGELVTALPPLARHGVVLFVPPDTIERKTARMFAALDRMPLDSGGVAEAFARQRPNPFTSADVYNDFERVAFDVFDGLHDLWAGLERRSGEPIRLAGAGPTLFWIGNEQHSARIAASAETLACDALVTRTTGPV